MTITLRREQFLNDLAFASSVSEEAGCPPLFDNVQTLLSWFNRGGGNQKLFHTTMLLEGDIERVYLRMMARATADEPNSVVFTESEEE